MSLDNYKVAFIISHKYYRNYESYIQYYVDNIQKFYENSLIIIVDNNSNHLEDIVQKFVNYNNVVILTNNSNCKFEIGAYNVGIRYLIDQNLTDIYDYCVFTQDNFVLKNKYDFNKLTNTNTTACTLYTFKNAMRDEYLYHSPISFSIFSKIFDINNINNIIPKLSLCWCNSFILHKSKICDFLNITKDLTITTRYESMCSERFLSGILYFLNNSIITNINLDLNKDIDNLSYDCWKINLINGNVSEYFAKRVQQKNENTIEK
jgi:hypothetical protein